MDKIFIMVTYFIASTLYNILTIITGQIMAIVNIVAKDFNLIGNYVLFSLPNPIWTII